MNIIILHIFLYTLFIVIIQTFHLRGERRWISLNALIFIIFYFAFIIWVLLRLISSAGCQMWSYIRPLLRTNIRIELFLQLFRCTKGNLYGFLIKLLVISLTNSFSILHILKGFEQICLRSLIGSCLLLIYSQKILEQICLWPLIYFIRVLISLDQIMKQICLGLLINSLDFFARSHDICKFRDLYLILVVNYSFHKFRIPDIGPVTNSRIRSQVSEC